MNIHETIKATGSVPKAAACYGMQIQRNNMTRCCFHDDHHYRPSPDAGSGAGYTWSLHAMTCLEHGDVIDLVAQQHRESHYATVQRIARNFGIDPSIPAPEVSTVVHLEEKDRTCM